MSARATFAVLEGKVKLLCLFIVQASHIFNIQNKAINIQSGALDRSPKYSKVHVGPGLTIIDGINYELHHNEFIQRCEVFAPPVHGLSLVIRIIICFVGVTNVLVVNV